MSEFTMLNVMLNLMDTSQWLTDHHSEHFPRLTTVKSRRFGKITSSLAVFPLILPREDVII